MVVIFPLQLQASNNPIFGVRLVTRYRKTIGNLLTLAFLRTLSCCVLRGQQSKIANMEENIPVWPRVNSHHISFLSTFPGSLYPSLSLSLSSPRFLSPRSTFPRVSAFHPADPRTTRRKGARVRCQLPTRYKISLPVHEGKARPLDRPFLADIEITCLVNALPYISGISDLFCLVTQALSCEIMFCIETLKHEPTDHEVKYHDRNILAYTDASRIIRIEKRNEIWKHEREWNSNSSFNFKWTRRTNEILSYLKLTNFWLTYEIYWF